jgi:hypothetical protein
MLDTDARTALKDLRWHWEDAYRIDCANGAWTAVPLADLSVTISCGTSTELREALRRDHATRASRRWAGNSST